MEDFSPAATPTTIKDCDELVRCLRCLLLTYDELWDVGWKKSLETTFVDFLENFERRNPSRLALCIKGGAFFLPPPAGGGSAAESGWDRTPR